MRHRQNYFMETVSELLINSSLIQRMKYYTPDTRFLNIDLLVTLK